MRLLLAALPFLALAPAAHALSAGDAIPGFRCASVPDAQLGRLPPVLDRPHGSEVGLAGATVIVAPRPSVHGYVELLLPNGRYAWIEEAKIEPWRSKSNPGAVCVPFVNGTGLPGIRYQ